MKFGFESEKLLYDLNSDTIHHGVLELVNALSDYESYLGKDLPRRIANEFVLNMVEMNTIASARQREVIEDYLLLHQVVSNVAYREKVVPLPLASVPFQFTPAMVPKWTYYVQNSILSGKRLKHWNLTPQSPLADAGNCAGLHAHFEVETPPEFLVFSDELVNKHNFGLMLTPMTAFSASPYFYGEYSAYSMRAHRYYNKVYQNFRLNGGLPPVMKTSEDILRYTLEGIEHWIAAGVKIGFPREDLVRLTAKKGANWSMLRWNRTWNTIELRCLESDRADYDISKFVWVAGAMKRLDSKGEALKPVAIQAMAPLDQAMISDALSVGGNEVTILPTHAIHDLTCRAVQSGFDDVLVESYIHRLYDFASPGVDEDCRVVFEILKKALDKRKTTAEVMLQELGHAKQITHDQCVPVIRTLLQREHLAVQSLRSEFGGIIRRRSEFFPDLMASGAA